MGVAMDDWLSRRWKAVLIGLVVVLLPVAIRVNIVLLDHIASHEMSWGERIERSEEYLYVYDKTLTNEDLEYIASLRNLWLLRLVNCNVAECRLRDLDFSGREIRYVDLTGTTGLWDLSFLSTIRADTVVLNDCPGVDDISALNWDELSDLEIDGTDVTDLSPLVGSQVSRLSFARTDVSDISPLAKLDNYLWRVNGSHTQVTTIDALANNDRLYSLCFDGCDIQEVRKPFAAERLCELSLGDTHVSDLSGFSGCAYLEKLNLRGTNLADMSWLNQQCRETLTSLDLGQAGFDAQGVSWVSSCKGLEELTVDCIDLGNLDLCRTLSELKWLSAVDCNLTDITGISGCGKLSTILLGYNKLQDIGTLPSHSSDLREMVVDLSHNRLSSVRDLPSEDYRMILLQGNEADVARTLPEGVSAYMLVIDWYNGIEDSNMLSSSKFDYIYLLGCPDEAREKLDETPWAWSWAVKYASEDEVLDMIEADDLDYSLFIDLGPYARLARTKLSEAN